MIDLHTHSAASDGSYSPSALIAEAAKQGISALALTDHDTIDGLQEAKTAAFTHGIHFIPGVELEISWTGPGEFHLLGLGLQTPSPSFMAAIEELGRRRKERNLEMVQRMNEAGIDVSYGDLIASTRGPSIGRPHFADFLVKRKITRNREQAFNHYLGKGKPFFIPKVGLEFDQAAEVIRESEGISVLAHPMSLYVSWGRFEDFIIDLKKRGLDGLEAWHPTTKLSACKRLELLGKKLGLCITAGSDFHGERRPGRKLGFTAGNKRIDSSLVHGITAIYPSTEMMS